MRGWNLFERLVLESFDEPDSHPRILVRRQSLGAGSLRCWPDEAPPMPGQFRLFLDALPAPADLSSYFALAPLKQQAEDSEFMELDDAHYFGQAAVSHGAAQLSFSLPARITSKTWAIYLRVYCNPLFGWDALYHFTGSPEEPENLRKRVLGAS